MSAVLAQSSAYPVVVGAGSIGPFAVPSASPGAEFTLLRSSMPAGLVFSAACELSFDGGVTWEHATTATLHADVPALPGILHAGLQIRWPQQPTHLRVLVGSNLAFNADFSVSAL